MKKLIHRIIIKIKAFFIMRSARFRHDMCYDDMESKGFAAFKCCGGLAGGDYYSDGLNYDCISCPYLLLGAKKKEVKE